MHHANRVFSVAGYRTIHGTSLTYHSQRQRASGDPQLVQAAGGICTAANPLLLNTKVGHGQICARKSGSSCCMWKELGTRVHGWTSWETAAGFLLKICVAFINIAA